MTASITAWTSSTSRNAESLMSKIVSDIKDPASTYESVSLANCEVPEMTKRIKGAFDRLVRMTMPDTTLHVVACVPLFEESSRSQIENLREACAQVPHNITLHVLGLAEGLARIFLSESELEHKSQYQQEAVGELERQIKGSPFSLSFSIIDDYSSTGAPIGFTMDSLSRYLALFQFALTADYYQILSPGLVASNIGKNMSIGLASLSFDRIATVNQLLGLGFLEALNRVGINDTEVNLQKAAHEAESLLQNIQNRYPNLYTRSIKPLYKENNIPEGKIVAEAAGIIDKELELLKSDILNILNSDQLTFPEKECILAMVLGRDNEKLRGMQYDHESTLLDDACREPLNLYIEAYNNYCPGSAKIPQRGDVKRLRLREPEDDVDHTSEEAKLNRQALNPLPEIKRLKQEILNITAFIREKTDELEELQKSISTRAEAENIRKNWKKPGGDLKKVEYKEQPLEEKYVPNAGLKPPREVDLRKFFNPVRDQEHLGACTSFAIASMYEARMRQEGVESENVMSPGFLYYHSNILTGRPGGGSNFFEQLEVLGKHGICHETLYAYNSDNNSGAPSEEAVADAANHHVLEARQIELQDTLDKTQSLRFNHEMLTSALAEGFPVGISLKVFDNFGKEGPFVIHPDDSPEAKEDGWHAMVIVGYSEERNIYIVRNSWGAKFGEEGYCYVPMAYIDDPEYLDFACIITKISESQEDVKIEVPATLADFAATETEIKMAAIRNTIAYQRIELQSDQKLYADYYSYYQNLWNQLTIPKVQNFIREKAEIAQAARFLDFDARKRHLEETFVGKLKQYKKELKYTIIISLFLAIVFGVIWYFTSWNWTWIAAVVLLGVGIARWFAYKWWVKRKRRKLQEELDHLAVESKRQADELLELQIKFHVAGMWIRQYHKISSELSSDYDRLVSYNDTLGKWQDEYNKHIGQLKHPEGEMFRVLDASPLLDSFFSDNKDKITSEIDLLKIFKDYTTNAQELEKTHDDLENVVKDAILSLLEDFNLSEYLMGKSYAYLPQADTQKELEGLIAVGKPSYRNPAMNATPAIHMILTNVHPKKQAQWEQLTAQYFPMRPLHLPITDDNILILLTIHPIE